CHDAQNRESELLRITKAAQLSAQLGIECHAGHGLDFETVGAIAAIPQMEELNIGHFLMGEAMFTGMDAAIAKMRGLMDAARA
ncbi:pyridoxine 5'-phosphate synthase, partial [Alphaproteobacteria bacterium]|nr:pyridoxine 5'-phosphate synthase [Alphaproteobacteria bacterium]